MARNLGRKLGGPPPAPRGAPGTCAHPPCTCPPREGGTFCSEWCERGHGRECHCHHPECAAPHHH